MKVTTYQTVKRYSITTNQTIKQVRVTALRVSRDFTITIAPLGKRGFKGDKGDKGDSSGTSIQNLVLPVNNNGQATFNIFNLPSSDKHLLLINGVEYSYLIDYSITQQSGNTTLNWLNQFSILIGMRLVFRTF